MNIQQESLSIPVGAVPEGTGPDFDLELLLSDPSVNRLTLRTEKDGVDQLVSYFRCEFQPGEKHFILHVPVQPAMSEHPAVQAMGVDEDLRIRTTKVEKFGVRLEAILDVVTTETKSLLVEVVLTSPLAPKK